MTAAEDDHEPLSNDPRAQELAAATEAGEGWPAGAYAALGLETLAGWYPPAPAYAAEATSPAGASARGVDSLLPAVDRPVARSGALYRPESTLGSDERVRVHETDKYPWRAICQLQIFARNGDEYIGTGFFVGPRTIATAGHCLYLPEMGGWAERIVVSPARNGSDRPFSSWTSTRFHAVRGWTSHGKRQHDYGAITLGPGDAAPELGTLAYAIYDSSCLMGSYLNLAGYPADKDEGTTLWWSARRTAAVDDAILTYDVDTAAGQSGAPVWRLDPATGGRVVCGIHTSGARTGNSATRINQRVFRNLQRWCKVDRLRE